jgi:hypothetical protein
MYCQLNENMSIPNCIESDGKITNKRRIGNDVERSGRGLFQGTIPPPAKTRLRKAKTIGVKVTGFLAETGTRHLQNTKQKTSRLSQLARFLGFDEA